MPISKKTNGILNALSFALIVIVISIVIVGEDDKYHFLYSASEYM